MSPPRTNAFLLFANKVSALRASNVVHKTKYTLGKDGENPFCHRGDGESENLGRARRPNTGGKGARGQGVDWGLNGPPAHAPRTKINTSVVGRPRMT